MENNDAAWDIQEADMRTKPEVNTKQIKYLDGVDVSDHSEIIKTPTGSDETHKPAAALAPWVKPDPVFVKLVANEKLISTINVDRSQRLVSALPDFALDISIDFKKYSSRGKVVVIEIGK